MSTFINTRLIGIVLNTLYIDVLYSGDSFHTCIISDDTKFNLINRGVREFDSFIELDAHHSEVFYNELISSLKTF